LSELGREARAIVEAGREGDDPTAEDRVRVKSALRRAILAGTVLAATSAASSTAKAASTAAPKLGATPAAGITGKTLAVLSLLSVLGAGLVVGVARRNSPEGPARGAATQTHGAAAPSSRALEPQGAELPPGAMASPNRDTAAPTALGEPPIRVPPAAPPIPAERRRASLPALVDRTPRTLPQAALNTKVGPSESPGGSMGTPGPDPLEAETRSLGEARVALLGGDPGRALELLDRQSVAYVHGQLSEERAAARVLALCKLGRLDEADAARAAFLRDSPHSLLVDRVRAGCPTR
jgi:hypothetical protein